MEDPRTGGETADQYTITTNNLPIQELASAGPSAIESFGPERSEPVVRVDILRDVPPEPAGTEEPAPAIIGKGIFQSIGHLLRSCLRILALQSTTL